MKIRSSHPIRQQFSKISFFSFPCLFSLNGQGVVSLQFRGRMARVRSALKDPRRSLRSIRVPVTLLLIALFARFLHWLENKGQQVFLIGDLLQLRVLFAAVIVECEGLEKLVVFEKQLDLLVLIRGRSDG